MVCFNLTQNATRVYGSARDLNASLALEAVLSDRATAAELLSDSQSLQSHVSDSAIVNALNGLILWLVKMVSCIEAEAAC